MHANFLLHICSRSELTKALELYTDRPIDRSVGRPTVLAHYRSKVSRSNLLFSELIKIRSQSEFPYASPSLPLLANGQSRRGCLRDAHAARPADGDWRCRGPHHHVHCVGGSSSCGDGEAAAGRTVKIKKRIFESLAEIRTLDAEQMNPHSEKFVWSMLTIHALCACGEPVSL